MVVLIYPIDDYRKEIQAFFDNARETDHFPGALICHDTKGYLMTTLGSLITSLEASGATVFVSTEPRALESLKSFDWPQNYPAVLVIPRLEYITCPDERACVLSRSKGFSVLAGCEGKPVASHFDFRQV